MSLVVEPETVAGGLTLIGGVALILNRIGLWSLGKKNENGRRSDVCGDHKECVSRLETNEDKVLVLNTNVEGLTKTCDKMSDEITLTQHNVSWIRGYLEKSDD